MCEVKETAYDYSAKMNIKGDRSVWRENREKLDYVLRKTHKYLKSVSTACDVGIGDGYMLTRLSAMGLKVTGIDMSSYSINYLRNNFKARGLDIELIQGDISNISLESNQFDVVTCFDVLEHIPGDNLALAINTLKKCLVDDGVIIGTLPLGENLSKSMVMCPKCGHEFHRVGHFHSFTTAEEISKLLEPWFTIIKTGEVMRSFFHTSILRLIWFYLFRFSRIIACRKVVKTVYFVARLSK